MTQKNDIKTVLKQSPYLQGKFAFVKVKFERDLKLLQNIEKIYKYECFVDKTRQFFCD